MRDAVCWITDYYVPECWIRACVHSPSPALLCRSRPDPIEEDSDVTQSRPA
jgi:hypothetical protein